MTTGLNHDRITIALSAGLTGSALAVGPYALAAAGGALAGLWLSPDLDLPKCRARRRWRNIGLGWLWWPYDKLLPHRSPWSHWPIVGTAGRLLYLGWPLLGWGDPVWLIWWPWFAAAAVGLAVADVGHWVADGCPI
ncbi:MAG: DUF2227 family putative metal-binding protein [Cyanobacteria bacterium J06635_1]